MDIIGKTLLGEHEHFMKEASVVDSPEQILTAVRRNIMKGARVVDELRKMVSTYPKEIAAKVASAITPCDHLLGIMWVDSKLFKNSADMHDFIRRRPSVKIIKMESLPHGSYWKNSSVRREIPRELFGRAVITSSEPLKAAFERPDFINSLVNEGVMPKGAAAAITEKLALKEISPIKAASVLETYLKTKSSRCACEGPALAADMEKTAMEIDISIKDDDEEFAMGAEVFDTLGPAEIDLDAMGTVPEPKTSARGSLQRKLKISADGSDLDKLFLAIDDALAGAAEAGGANFKVGEFTVGAWTQNPDNIQETYLTLSKGGEDLVSITADDSSYESKLKEFKTAVEKYLPDSFSFSFKEEGYELPGVDREAVDPTADNPDEESGFPGVDF